MKNGEMGGKRERPGQWVGKPHEYKRDVETKTKSWIDRMVNQTPVEAHPERGAHEGPGWFNPRDLSKVPLKHGDVWTTNRGDCTSTGLSSPWVLHCTTGQV